MSKTRSEILSVVEAYTRELTDRFPFVETEVQSIKGSDVYLRVLVPTELWGEAYDKIADTTPVMNYRYWDETNVYIVAVIVTKQPEGAHHG